jgi:hypothetical protein
MTFAAVMPRVDALRGHLVLARRAPDPLFTKIETISPRNHVHHFRLTAADELTPQFRAYIAEAYRVGNQEHLQAPMPRTLRR